jgi:leucyl-tRNA synthetase
MNPFIPHFTCECLNNLDHKQLKWPTVSKEQLVEKEINFVVQINGKKRALLKVKRDMDENEILKEIKLNKETEKFLENRKIQKTIFVSNRLINIIL